MIRASGGLLAPTIHYGPKVGEVFYVTYRVRWPWRRWWLRRHGWSTEWTVEYVREPLHKSIPKFTASRGWPSVK
jgi:hypothetical protein